MEKVVTELLGAYDLRLDPSLKVRLGQRLKEMCLESPGHLTSELIDLVGVKMPAEFGTSAVYKRAEAQDLRVLSVVESLRFCAEPARFPAASERGNRYWHRGVGVLWNDPTGGAVGVQVIQPVEGDKSKKPALELFYENFPMEDRLVIYLTARKK